MPDVSQTLGEYMLQGWVLTDDVCPTPKCCTPLMRAPLGRPREIFCAKCDGGPIGSSARIAKPDQSVPIADTPSVSSASSVLQSKRSRASTPPTDISSPHSHDEEFVLPPPTEEMLARRAQSDYASAEIGKRLLQGWAMLADECLNSTCYGVPLLRPPRRLTDLNPSTKECVVCKGVYIDAPDGSGLRLQESHPEPHQSTRSTAIRAPSTNAQGSNLGQSVHPAATPSQSVASTNTPVAQPRSSDLVTTQVSAAPLSVSIPAPLFGPAPSTAALQIPSDPSLNLPLPASNPTTLTLRTTVTVLTARLNTLISSPPPLNVAAIGEVSDALGRTLDAIEKARKVFG